MPAASTESQKFVTLHPNPPQAAKGNPAYEVMGVTRYWRYSKERMQEFIDAGRVVQPRPGAVPRNKRYLDEVEGRPLQEIWDDIPPINSQAKERLGYPTQKPGAKGIGRIGAEPSLTHDWFMVCGRLTAVPLVPRCPG